MTLEGAEGRIWCSEMAGRLFHVRGPPSIDGEAALAGSSPGTRDQQSLNLSKSGCGQSV